MNPCGSNAYNHAVEASLKTILGPVVSMGKVRYRVITDALPSARSNDYKDRQQYWQTIEILGNSSAIAAINKSIRERIGERGELGLGCRSTAMNHAASEGFDFQEVGVTILGRLIGVTRIGAFDCRERSIQAFEETYMWNLTTGKQESLFSWLKGAEVKSEREYGNPPIFS